MSRSGSRGFTLIETLIVVAVIGVAAGIAVPSVDSAMRLHAVNNGMQSVVSAIRSARYIAVSKNKTVRVRFNCPSAGEFRIVEVVGTGVDSVSNRCNRTAYPYPDPDAAAVPDVDGPVQRLPARVTFGAFQDMEIDTNGRVTALAGCPACGPTTGSTTINVTNGSQTRTIAITANGRITPQ